MPGAGFARPASPAALSDWSNRPCTLPLSDSTRDTPVVMSTMQAVAAQHVLALGQHHAAGHGDEVGLGVEDRGLAGHDLVLLRDDDTALGLQPADRRTAARTGGRRLHRRGFRAALALAAARRPAPRPES